MSQPPTIEFIVADKVVWKVTKKSSHWPRVSSLELFTTWRRQKLESLTDVNEMSGERTRRDVEQSAYIAQLFTPH